MRIQTLLFGTLAALAILATGCAGPEKKLGRGLVNVTEFTRLGELRRSVEQTYLETGRPEVAYTRGFIKGFNRSVARTLVGAYEVVTFPIPSYEPWLTRGNKYIPDAATDPVYPDSFTPGLITSSTFETDTFIGFAGSDVAPFIPGSRFRIFEY